MFTLRLVCKDICNGLENIQVPVTNIIDIPPVAPEGKLHPSQNLKDYFYFFTFINRVTANGMTN